jgi:transcriptional regulator with XRE-family HTH domain
MTTQNLEYFEVLPWHPQPQIDRLESLTGYIKCVLFENDICSLSHAAKLLFPNQPLRVIRELADYTPLDMSTIIRTLAKSLPTLQQCTFYHLVRKFARATNPQSQSRFLSGLISPHLRYCTSCLSDFGCFSLLWRFKPIKCCSIHHEEIIENCPHCERTLPILPSRFTLFECPFCAKDLRYADKSLPKLPSTFQLNDLLYYLLRATDWEENAQEIISNVGHTIKAQRQQYKMTRESIAKVNNLSVNTIQGIERGSLNNGATLNAYLVYSHYLGINLKKVFETSIKTLGSQKHPTEKVQEYQLLSSARIKMAEMLQNNQTIQINSVSKQMSVSENVIRKYKRLHKLIRRMKSYTQSVRLQSLLKLVIIAAQEIKTLRGYASQRAVAQRLGIPRRTLRSHRFLIQIIKTINKDFYPNSQLMKHQEIENAG